MHINEEIEHLHEKKLKTVKFKWFTLFCLSQILWIFFIGLMMEFKQESIPAEKMILPKIQSEHIRLELPLHLYFPINSFPEKIVIHHQENKTLLSKAFLQAKSTKKKGSYIVDIPSKDLKRLLPLPQGELEAYPDKTVIAKRRFSYEINF
jgi:hypothetical protein